MAEFIIQFDKFNQRYLSKAILQNNCLEKILRIIIGASVAEIVFSKILWFQHMLLNTFRRILLCYENCSLWSILF